MAARSQIQFWRPIHDLIVNLHLGGINMVTIASIVGRTQANISQIINSPQAQSRIAQATAKIRSELMTSTIDRIIDLSAKSIENIAVTVETKADAASAFKRHQDAVGFKLLELAGYGPKGDNGKSTETAQPLLSEDRQERLLAAVKKADEARNLAIEADYEVVPVKREDSRPDVSD